MSTLEPSEPDPFAPPDDATVDRAIADFARAVRDAYGSRVKGIYLFGSRARGDHTPDSDADVAVVLSDQDWEFWTEKLRLADLAYDVLMASGAELQGWPVLESEWKAATPKWDAALIENMRTDAVPIGRHE